MSTFATLTDPADFQGRAAGETADLQRKASQESIDELRRQFDLQQGRLDPFFRQSEGAINLLSQFSGAQGADAQQAAFANLQDSPGARFRREQAQKSVIRDASVTGGLGGGNVLRQSQQAGISSAQQELNDELNRLSSIAGIAQTTGGQLGQAGQQFASQFANQLNAGAALQGQNILGQQQNKAGLLSSAAGLFAAFSDEDMKHNVKDMSNEDCYGIVMSTPISVWSYLEECGVDDGVKRHFGPMYQQAPECIKFDGKKALDVHDELWLIAGAMKHMVMMMEANNG